MDENVVFLWTSMLVHRYKPASYILLITQSQWYFKSQLRQSHSSSFQLKYAVWNLQIEIQDEFILYLLGMQETTVIGQQHVFQGL